MKKPAAVALLLAFCLTALMGCNTAQNTNPGTIGGEQVRESILRMTNASTPVLDPHVHAGYASAISYANQYEALIFPRGESLEPSLAESWSANPEGNEYTFKLKQGVRFHDGVTEMKASDVVFSANRFLTMGEGFSYLYNSIIKEAVIEDDYTIKFVLHNAFGPFVESLVRLYIVSEKMVMGHKAEGPYGEFGDYGRDWLSSHDAGTGPYTTTGFVLQEYWQADQFSQWHGGWENRPHAPKQIRVINNTEPTDIRAMMSAQELEISDMWQTNENLAAMSELKGVSVAAYSDRLVQNVFFNTAIAPTDDASFRKALACLFDYQMLADTVFYSGVCAGPVSKLTAGHVDITPYSYTIEKAKEYLAKSKYANNYQNYPLEFLFILENNALEEVSLAFQSTAAEIGIPVNVTKAPWATIQERVSSAATTPHLSCINSGPQYNEAGATLESQFHSKTQGTYENAAWLGTLLDAEIEDALSTVDKSARFAKYAILQEKIVKDLCPAVWIADLVNRVAYQDTYLKWPVAEGSEIQPYMMGYAFYAPDMELYTDR